MAEVYINKDRITVLRCEKRTTEEIVMECEAEGIDTYLFFSVLSLGMFLADIAKNERSLNR